jgi:cytochrome c oxidase subunit 4
MSDKHEEHGPHMGIPQYLIVFGILVVGTIVTYLVALTDLDSMLFPGANTLVALLIAFTKMSAVVLFFMHVYWNSKLIWLTAAGSFVFLAIMFAFTIQDFMTRDTGIFHRTEAVKSK